MREIPSLGGEMLVFRGGFCPMHLAIYFICQFKQITTVTWNESMIIR